MIVTAGNNLDILRNYLSEKFSKDYYAESEDINVIKNFLKAKLSDKSVNKKDLIIYASFKDYNKLYKLISYAHKIKLKIHVLRKTLAGDVRDLYFPYYSNLLLFVKRVLDILVSFFGITLGLPIWLIIALICGISSGGNPIFTQERITSYGRVFKMCKFRSMYAKSKEKGGAHWTHQGDKRITKFGSFIRKHSIDEFAQLINVLKGEMSLIGPRPERPELVSKFIKEIDCYELRHLSFKAGMSGWAQVNGYRGDTSLEKRVEYDLYYLQNWSLWLDFRIFIKTFIKGLSDENAY